MRLLLKLRANGNFTYNLSYHNKLRGLIYHSIEEDYPELHDKHTYKHFCFSNLFPLKIKNGEILPINDGEIKNLLISSPDKILIKTLIENFPENINIGEMSFSLENIKLLSLFLNKNSKITTATPIVMRIPSYNYEKYNINSDKEYVYWRKQYSFSAFVKQLEENLIKKYNVFHNTDIEEQPLFSQFIFKKEICNHVTKDSKTYQVIGSIWEFPYNGLTKWQKKILSFGIDCGFGEMNTSGFGFVNLIR